MFVFENLGEEKAHELLKKFTEEGMAEEEAFDEVYSIECNHDNEEE